MSFNEIPLFVGRDVDGHITNELKTDADMKDSVSFRIPSLITADNGNVIAAADRASTGADWGKIDIAVRISRDSGNTWSEMKLLTNAPTRIPPVTEEDTASAFAIDPVMTVCENGDILLMFDFWPECKGLHDRTILENGSGYVNIGGKRYLALFDANSGMNHISSKERKTGFNCYTVRENGVVYDPDGEPTPYYLPQNHACYENGYGTVGDMYYRVGEPDWLDSPPPLIPGPPAEGKDIYVGNIYLNVAVPPINERVYFVQKYVADENTPEPFTSPYPVLLTKPAPLRAAVTSYIWCMRSSDGGETWSAPRDLNAMIKRDEDAGFLGVSPGNGIKLRYQKNESYNGRILVPVYNLDAGAVVYSDDNGCTWYRNTKGYIRLVGENQLFEYTDGYISAVSRPTWVSTPRTVFSKDAGCSWNNGDVLKIACVHCQKSIITMPVTSGKQYVLASHSTGHFGKDDSRTAGVVSFGYTRNINHSVRWLSEMAVKETARYKAFGVYDDFFAYSSLSVLPDGCVGLLYEAFPAGYIVFAKYTMNDILISGKPAKAKKSGA